MTRGRWIALAALVFAGGITWWVANNTYFEETKVPMPLKGEALSNPFYAVQRFADRLEARTSWDRVLTVPESNAVVVLHAWHWSLSAQRREAIERWVESGGRLVVDNSVSGGEDEFEAWSGIGLRYHEYEENDPNGLFNADCRMFNVEPYDLPRQLCNAGGGSHLVTDRPALWTLRDKTGVQALRIAVGGGSVTVVNASYFTARDLFTADHARVFVDATQLRKGDRVVFLSERDHPSLLALMWQHGGPAVALALGLVILWLWRDAVRLGPFAETPEPARRSLAEQIRGTGQFVMRHGHGDALHAATVRAMNEAAGKRIPNYARLSAEERVEALAGVTRMDRDTLAAAVHQSGVRRSRNLRATIALVESVRRQLLTETHGA